jgi:hypothetical protein
MSVLPTTMVSPLHAVAGAPPTGTPSSRAGRRGSFLLVAAAALAVAACGDITIGPVDHSCPVENACQHAGGR